MVELAEIHEIQSARLTSRSMTGDDMERLRCKSDAVGPKLQAALKDHFNLARSTIYSLTGTVKRGAERVELRLFEACSYWVGNCVILSDACRHRIVQKHDLHFKFVALRCTEPWLFHGLDASEILILPLYGKNWSHKMEQLFFVPSDGSGVPKSIQTLRQTVYRLSPKGMLEMRLAAAGAFSGSSLKICEQDVPFVNDLLLGKDPFRRALINGDCSRLRLMA